MMITKYMYIYKKSCKKQVMFKSYFVCLTFIFFLYEQKYKIKNKMIKINIFAKITCKGLIDCAFSDGNTLVHC